MTNDPLALALARLQDFRARFGADTIVDKASGLTAEDLDCIAAAAHPKTDLEPGGSMTVDDLAGNA